MIAVVTGGSGFLGRNLVYRLLRDGHEVRCLVRPSGGIPPTRARRFVVDFEEPRSLLKCAALDGADVVFHVAGVTKAAGARNFVSGNVTPTRHLLGALVARRLRPRFVLVSSQAAAGPATDARHPIDEEDVPRPVEEYGRSKLEAERIAESFLDRVPVTIVRPCSVFGPYDRDFLVLFRLAARGLLVFPGTAEHWLSLLHVDDVSDAMVQAGTSDVAIARTYFLASREAVQWRTLGDHLAAAVGRSVRTLDLPTFAVQSVSAVGEWLGRLSHRVTLANRSKAALARQPFWVCSSARASSELGLRESHSLPDSVRDTYYWYRENGWVRGSRPPAAAT